MPMRNFNDTIGNRTRVLPACGAVAQPNAPSRTPYFSDTYQYFYQVLNQQSQYINFFLFPGCTIFAVFFVPTCLFLVYLQFSEGQVHHLKMSFIIQRN
jgi:hypothetical protein